MSIARLPHWRDVDTRIVQALRPVINANENNVKELVRAVGTEQASDIRHDIVVQAQELLAKEFGIAAPGELGRSLWGQLLAKWVRFSGDPDDVIPAWVTSATPLGIVRPIETKGVFPPSDKHTAPSAVLEEAEAQTMWMGE